MLASRVLVYQESPVANDSTVEHWVKGSLPYVLSKPSIPLQESMIAFSRKVDSLAPAYAKDPLGPHLPAPYMNMLESDASIESALLVWRDPPRLRTFVPVDDKSKKKKKKKETPVTSTELIVYQDGIQMIELPPTIEQAIARVGWCINNLQIRTALLHRTVQTYYEAKHYSPPRWAYPSQAEWVQARTTRLEAARKKVQDAYEDLKKMCNKYPKEGEEYLSLIRERIPLLYECIEEEEEEVIWEEDE
jgi:hypothetical protein